MKTRNLMLLTLLAPLAQPVVAVPVSYSTDAIAQISGGTSTQFTGGQEKKEKQKKKNEKKKEPKQNSRLLE